MGKIDQTLIDQIAKRNQKTQRVGIELELYAVTSFSETMSYVHDKFPAWQVVQDGSLYAYRDTVKIPKKVIEGDIRTPVARAYAACQNQLGTFIGKHTDKLAEWIPRFAKVSELTPDEAARTLKQIIQEMLNDKHLNEVFEDGRGAREVIRYEDKQVQREGAEVRSAAPMTRRGLDKYFKELVQIANDDTLVPRFDNPEDGRNRFDGRPEMTGDNYGMAGLHFHFGLNPHIQYSALDAFRLARHVHENAELIEKLANRPHTRWARPLDSVIANIDQAIHNLSRGNKSCVMELDWFQTPGQGFRMDSPRYYGVNFTEVGEGRNPSKDNRRKLHTIEFRWAHANVAASMDSLTAYYNFLANAVDTCMTGHRELQWGQYTLKDVSFDARRRMSGSHEIRVFKGDKYLGLIVLNNLCKSFRTNRQTIVERIASDRASRPVIVNDILRHKMAKEQRKRIQNELISFAVKKGDNTISKVYRAFRCKESGMLDELVTMYHREKGTSIYEVTK